MPNATVVDTSCLILLNKIDALNLLDKLFAEVIIAQVVADEFNKPLPDWVKIVEVHSTEMRGLASFLDPGEAASITLASSREDSLLIIDESKGRKVAKEMELQITGSIGVFVAAKQKGYVKAVKPIIDRVQQTNIPNIGELN